MFSTNGAYRAGLACPAASARHAEAAAYDFNGDALHALWGAEGMLLAAGIRDRAGAASSLQIL